MNAEQAEAMLRHTSRGRGTRVLETQTRLPVPVEDAFAFFSDVRNLERITPPELAFRILSPLPLEIAEGSVIEFRLRLFGVPFGWQTLISGWEPPRRFVDRQTRGPYACWVHLHEFEPDARGTRMTDRVEYRLPLHPLSAPALPLVRRELTRIFRYRAAAMRSILAG
jgi:ligand-binding SRPBCC domain-containing protein